MLRRLPVEPVTRYSDVLRAAAESLGGDRNLAAFLDVSRDELDRWMKGDASPPLPAFLAALDVAADGPYTRQRRRIRVAVIRSPETQNTQEPATPSPVDRPYPKNPRA